MKLPCYLVQDLLPLYKDNVCDPQTAQDVREHLEICDACRAVLRAMDPPEEETAAAEAKDTSNAAALTSVKKDLNARWKKTALAVAGVFLCLFFAFFGWQQWMMNTYVTPDFTDLRMVHKDSSHDHIAFQCPSTGVYYATEGYITKYYNGVPIAFLSVTQTRWDELMQRFSPRETPIWIPAPGTSIAVVNHETYQALCAEEGRITIAADRLIELLAADDSFYVPVTTGTSANFESVREAVADLTTQVRDARAETSKSKE